MLIDGCQSGARCPLNLDWGSKSQRHLDTNTTRHPHAHPCVLPQPWLEFQTKVGGTFIETRNKVSALKSKTPKLKSVSQTISTQTQDKALSHLKRSHLGAFKFTWFSFYPETYQALLYIEKRLKPRWIVEQQNNAMTCYLQRWSVNLTQSWIHHLFLFGAQDHRCLQLKRGGNWLHPFCGFSLDKRIPVRVQIIIFY